MSWQKRQTKTGRHVPTEQIDLTLIKCKHGRELCIEAYNEVPEKSVAFLLYRLCKCYEDIIKLLNGNNPNPKQTQSELDILQWLPDKLDCQSDHSLANEKIGELLFFQQELLYQLRITISLFEDRHQAFELSGSVATFQILHDYLAQFHSRSI